MSLAAWVLAVAMASTAHSAPEQPTAPSAGASDTPGPAPGYVGRAACADCHAEQARAWRGSHHDLAMDAATEATVLGDFDEASFTEYGVTSTFSRKDGGFYVRTDGPDGELRDYRIDFVIGVDPLQQYLIAFPGGRYQVLGLAWDSRPAEAGGQRWFHLNPNEAVSAGDPLHWTGRLQNWNAQCAECHATNLEKNYDLETDSFATGWSEINVSCEACHGLGADHIAWARSSKTKTERVPDGGGTKGLARRFLVGDATGGWTFGDASPTARWYGNKRLRTEIETCARCHARRRAIIEDGVQGRRFLDSHMPALLTDGLYHADGQIDDEVYVYGSFVQSRMYGAGVTCGDCHEPHALTLRAAGNSLCAQCHRPEVFDRREHHHHSAASAGAQCVACHMPVKNYMVVDPRRDHSLRVPRPDLTLSLGTPNACSQCHLDRSARWAADLVAEWFPEGRHRTAHFGAALKAGRDGAPEAATMLAALAGDTEQPGIVRATALSALARFPGQVPAPIFHAGLSDPDPIVRAATVEALATLPMRPRFFAVGPRLEDPVRAVRIAAARALADVPRQQLTPAQRQVLDRATREFIAGELAAAERPESHLNLGSHFAARGDLQRSEAAYLTALRLDRTFVPAYVNLADLYRVLRRDGDAEEILRQAIGIAPEDAAPHHALGLHLVRRGQVPAALPSLRRAAELGRETPRYSYVYGVALNSTGESTRAIDVLGEAHERHPTDRDILFALATVHRDAGERDAAARYAEKLVRLFSQDAQARQLARELGLAVD